MLSRNLKGPIELKEPKQQGPIARETHLLPLLLLRSYCQAMNVPGFPTSGFKSAPLHWTQQAISPTGVNLCSAIGAHDRGSEAREWLL